jgi:hypothetical protein
MDRRVALALWIVVAAPLVACSEETPAKPAGAAAAPAPAAPELPAGAPKLEFTDRAHTFGLAPQFRGKRTGKPAEDMMGGVAVADLDRDGRPDILAVGAGPLPEGGQTRLYRNETELRGGTLVLKDVTKEAALPGLLPTTGVAVADTDGDGDLDVLLTLVGGLRFLRNEGGLVFFDATRHCGLGDADGWCTGATFGDTDGDGDLDLYVCRYAKSDGQPASNLLYRNDGAGKFEGGEALAKELGLDGAGARSLGALFGDFDLDDLPDLCVAGESGFVAFRGTKAEGGRRGFVRGGPLPGTSAGLAAADGDGDGRDDIFVGDRTASAIRHLANVESNGSWFFLATAGPGATPGQQPIATPGVTAWSLDLADFDLDGRPDLFAAGGSAAADSAQNAGQRSLVCWNAGKDRGFVDVGATWGAAWNTPRNFRGGAAADLDGDGDPDVVLGAVDGGPPAVLINEGDRRGRPLTVALSAPAPNTFGVGARVTVKCDGRVQSREMRSSPGYLSAGPLVVHFGLGDAKGPVTVSVRWPDGTTSENVVDPAERWPVITKSR